MESPYELDRDTEVRRVEEHLWRGAVSDRWSIGPYPNGGYVLAIAMSAIRHELPHPDPFTITAHYLSPPQHAPIDVAVEVLRSGRAHSTAMARMLQEGRERVRVLANYGDHSQSRGPTLVQASPPAMPPPGECPPVDGPERMPSGLVAAIRERVDIRPSPDTWGWARGAPTGRAEIGGWLRFADGRPVDTHALPLIADAFPPAIFDAEPGGWVPTLELTVQVRARPRGEWMRCWFRTRFLMDGYLEEDGEVWDESGTLCALSRQLARLNPPPTPA